MTVMTHARSVLRRAAEEGFALRARATAPKVSPEKWYDRLVVLARALEPDAADLRTPAAAERTVLRLLTGADDAVTWLALSVLSARLPPADEVIAARRDGQLFGPSVILDAAKAVVTEASVRRDVRVLHDATLVDMGDLVLYPLGTGIQRVARSVITQWRADREFTAIGWTTDMDAIYALDDAARDAALAGRKGTVDDDEPEGPVVVPWGGTYMLPELAIQPRRCLALQALARYAPTRCGVIGFDCVPLTSAETSAAGFPAVFALNLAAVAEFDVVAGISAAAAAEYAGWRRMLGGAGLPGPAIEAILLPADAPEPSGQDLADARDRFVVADLPLVLCVGSHEPRKNHLSVLHSAELLWRRGLRFSLTFVGGASWNSDEFSARLAELEGAGRPVESVSRLSDRLLWGAYRLARCTVFPSVNEGFGLPVAESLAAGTPAITSGFGSMAEIAADGGALLVDPRDDDGLTEALHRLLVDDELHRRLSAEARDRPPTSWRGYAARLWDVFHDTTGGPQGR